MSGLNSLYIASLTLEDYYVSNQSALALANGSLYFYVDSNRTQAKSVFELVQATGYPFNYSYQPLPNPIILSNSGTVMDANGNNTPIYYYPYDQYGNVQLYYIECYDSQGNLQFTREAWPFPYAGGGGGGGGGGGVGITNYLINPQFADVYFVAPTLTITIGSATTITQPIAPGWVLSATTTASTSLTVTQTPVTGNLAYPNNPPFVLTITPGASISALSLTQTFVNNPDWAAPQMAAMGGFLSGSILLAPNSFVNMQYVANSGNPPQTIINQTNTGGAYAQINATVQLLAAASSYTGATGTDSIVLNLSPNNVTTISNVQVTPTATNVSIAYEQSPVNRQRAYYQNIVNVTGGIYTGNTGRLTLQSNVPVSITDQTAKTTLYYTPYKGSNIWLYINGEWINYSYSQISIAVPAVATKMYDVFATITNGVVALILTAWTNDSTRATALTTQDGVYVQAGNLNRRYLGSFRTISSGQTEDSVANRFLYNYYNRVNRNMVVVETTSSWNYTTATWRQANGNSANQLNFCVGVVEDAIKVNVMVVGANASTAGVGSGVGINSTSVNSATIYGANFFGTIYTPSLASYEGTGYSVGVNYMAWLEISDAQGTTTWVGTAISLAGFTSELGIVGILPM